MELTRDESALQAQLRYALWLKWGARVGLALLAAGFAAYVLGWKPHVPIEQLPSIWGRPAADYLQSAGLRPGWHWAALLHRSDMLALGAIALLASCSIPCLAAVIPEFARRRERVFVAICVLEIAVLVIAASGLVALPH
jgi:hypothetical protein